MDARFTSSTHIWRYIDSKSRRKERTRGEKSATGRISHFLYRGGVTNMERLATMTEAEILKIPGIRVKSYRFIREALEDFKADLGETSWEMPDFDDDEFDWITVEMRYRKPEDYLRLVYIFHDLALDENHHSQIELMEQIYYKLDSITRDEFAAIMAVKGVNIEDYKL